MIAPTTEIVSAEYSGVIARRGEAPTWQSPGTFSSQARSKVRPKTAELPSGSIPGTTQMQRKTASESLRSCFVLALPIFTARASYRHAVRDAPGERPRRLRICKERPQAKACGLVLCWHYLFSRPVARQLSSAQMSLTSVFGMGTGGPSSQSTRTMWMAFNHLLYISKALKLLISLVTHTGFEPMLTA